MIVFVLQGMFEPYLKGFFVHSSDPTHIRLLKVNIFGDHLQVQVGIYKL